MLSEQLCSAVRDANVAKVQELVARGCSVHKVDVEESYRMPKTYPSDWWDSGVCLEEDAYLLAAYYRQEIIMEFPIEQEADSFRGVLKC